MNTGKPLMQLPGTTRLPDLEHLLRRQSRLDLEDSFLMAPDGRVLAVASQPDAPLGLLDISKAFLLPKNFVDRHDDSAVADGAQQEFPVFEDLAKLGVDDKETVEGDQQLLQAFKELFVFRVWF